MLRIAVCDDEKQERDRISRAAEAYFRGSGREIKIHAFSSSDDLLNSADPFDLYLLDVLMPGTDGIRAAEILKAADPDAVIVFITSMIDSAVDSYRVEASGFLLKPVSEEAFAETMDRLSRKNLLGKEEALRIIYDHLPVDIPLNRIVVLESDLHRVHIRLNGDIYTISQRLKTLEDSLSGHDEFLRCHQSFLVNLAYVSQIEYGDFVLREDIKAGIRTVPISRAYLKGCKKAFYDYKLKGKRG